MSDISAADREKIEAELLKLLEEEELYRKRNALFGLYPETGPLRRELYPKHMQHLAAGRCYNERALIGANRSGKSLCCSYETACHLIGWYPEWWDGFRFNRSITAWCAGEDTKSTRESLQVILLGKTGEHGTGLIPSENLMSITARSGVPEAVDTVTVKTRWGGVSRLLFKSYDQGRTSFQAAKVDIMQFDEEPPADIYSEGLTRTMSTVPGEPNGLVICGFTPLSGLSTIVMSFMPGGERKEGALG